MIDLHTHTVFSDGELIPFELARRAENMGYKFIAFTDHMDFSSFDFIAIIILLSSSKSFI
jgi:histidinol phosphatase-like PHP family hydrolase